MTPTDHNAKPLRSAQDQAVHGLAPPTAAIAEVDTALTAAMQRYLLDLY